MLKLKDQEDEYQEITSKFSIVTKDYEKFKALHDRVLNDNNLLKSKIKFYEEENQSLNKRYGELNSINFKYEEENSSLKKQLNSFRDEYETLKEKNENTLNDLLHNTEENFTLKVKYEDRSKLIEEISAKYETLKNMSEEKEKKSEGVNFLNYLISLIFRKFKD